ncbi:capsular biosynthesis protein [Tenericutes bacterium MZ-XQ]|nr:capsular biosynthesis protein [Tenericutes bacterium MZ-XQ]
MNELRNIPFSPPDITEEEINEVVDALRSGWITTGPKTKEFEKKIAEYIGVNKAVCLNSATAAMELSLHILGIGPGDEVITSAYTYTASASVIHHVGAKIVLVDTAADSFEMDYDQLEKAITKKTKAIIPVDIAGVICDYDRIYKAIENKKHLFKPSNKRQEVVGRVIVLSDAAHSFGATKNGKKSGLFADITCFSFHAVKNLTTAEGGAVVWQHLFGMTDDELYKEFMLYSLHGQSKDAFSKMQKGAWEYDILYPAFKNNMTDILAGVGLVQLKRYDGLLERRFELIKLYEKVLDRNKIQVIKHYDSNFRSSGHLLLCNLIGLSVEQRNKVIIELAEKGISTNVHYKPLPMFTAYKNLGFHIEDYPNAYNKYSNEITLPLYTLLSNEDVVYVSQCVNQILDREVE